MSNPLTWETLQTAANSNSSKYLGYEDLCQLAHLPAADQKIINSEIARRFWDGNPHPQGNRELFVTAFAEIATMEEFSPTPGYRDTAKEEFEKIAESVAIVHQHFSKIFFPENQVSRYFFPDNQDNFFARHVLYVLCREHQYETNFWHQPDRCWWLDRASLNTRQSRWLAWCVVQANHPTVQTYQMALLAEGIRNRTAAFRENRRWPFLVHLQQLQEDITYLSDPENVSNLGFPNYFFNPAYKRVLEFCRIHYDELTVDYKEDANKGYAVIIFAQLDAFFKNLSHQLNISKPLTDEQTKEAECLKERFQPCRFGLEDLSYSLLMNPPTDFSDYFRRVVELDPKEVNLTRAVSEQIARDNGNIEAAVMNLYDSCYVNPTTIAHCPPEVIYKFLEEDQSLIRFSSTSKGCAKLANDAIAISWGKEAQPKETYKWIANDLAMMPFFRELRLVDWMRKLGNFESFYGHMLTKDKKEYREKISTFLKNNKNAINHTRHSDTVEIASTINRGTATRMHYYMGAGGERPEVVGSETLEKAAGSLRKYQEALNPRRGALLAMPRFADAQSRLYQNWLEVSEDFSVIEEQLKSLVLESAMKLGQITESGDVDYKEYAYPHRGVVKDFSNLSYALCRIANKNCSDPFPSGYLCSWVNHVLSSDEKE